MSLRSFHRGLLAARFFGKRLGDWAILSRVRVLNRLLAAPGPAGGLEAIDAMLDEDVVIREPSVAEARLRETLERYQGPRPPSPEELERHLAEDLARRVDDLPEVEDFPLCPEEETPEFTSLQLTLDLRFLRALRRWQGRSDVSLSSLILESLRDRLEPHAGLVNA